MANELYATHMLQKQGTGVQTTFRVHGDFESVWMSQQTLANFFEVSLRSVTQGISHVLTQYHCDKAQVVRRVNYVDNALDTAHSKKETQYALSVIIFLAWHIDSPVAIAFRQWSMKIVDRYLIKGHVIDKQRLKTYEKRMTVFRRAISFLSDR